MSIKASNYEKLLCEYSDRTGAISLLKQHRPYLEMLPSLRRPQDSLITIPLPVVKVRQPQPLGESRLTSPNIQEAIHLPCDLAIIMCDPEWKIKLGSEIIVFIHRPHEDFSHLLTRWRQTQIHLDKDYEWLMPPKEQHMFSEGADKVYPLFVLFENTLERIKKGLKGACLPYIVQTSIAEETEEVLEMVSE
ncbi:hypothetical protein [Crocosphaera sp. XPORK-15E]|uniref:hypothetical protein n=1 Tax=Crocosphaera sp. XPORK-15E TaxID=3110247 RepID=UPI002B215DA6|nr:hypothetical protein [Crocosphaera sp. XPORK-15E]MEA5534477.1 hypothetical protein [Crocosphaera sp. XPORK-15E]